jgi:hypothetical protein
VVADRPQIPIQYDFVWTVVSCVGLVARKFTSATVEIVAAIDPKRGIRPANTFAT